MVRDNGIWFKPFSLQYHLVLPRLYGSSKTHLLHREIPAEIKREAHIQFLLSPVVYAIAIGVSFFVPWISIAIFILTPILYLIPSKIDNYLP
ncbi:MAG TPA: hypothetical protein VIM07_01795 [Chitinophagaceae bacterium]